MPPRWYFGMVFATLYLCMEIQLTKTKTITIGGGASSAGKGPAVRDLVGIDLFSGDPRGCPAVRLALKKNTLRVVAAGFVPPPDGGLPASWEDAAKKCSWSVPTEFQAAHAAFAISSDDLFFSQTTAEAFKADLAAGGHAEGAKPKDAGETKKRIGLLRPGNKAKAKAEESKPKADVPVPDFEPGVPVSHGGTRFIMCPMTANEGFVLEAGMPEYQLLWLSRLLPEGRRPTAASIQPRFAALAASLSKSSALAEAGGNALAVFIDDETVHIAGYRNGALVLWRACRECGGWNALRAQVKRGLGLEDDMVESVLNDTLIDPTPALEPALEPILRELAVSRDYLAGKLETQPKAVLVLGLKAGGGYWKNLVRARLGLALVEPPVFAGLDCPEKTLGDPAFKGSAGHVFLGALGAALAFMRAGEKDAPLHLNLLSESECVSSSPVRLRVMAPILTMLAGLGMLVWWGVLFGNLLMVTAQTNTLEDDLARNKATHRQVLEKIATLRELETEAEQLEGYRLSRQTWGTALSALAEVMPLKVQLTKLEIPPPPPQVLTPLVPKGPLPWGPTETTEDVLLVLSGRTPKETPVISMMESLESESFTNVLTIVKDPRSPQQSPRVRSFRQDADAHGRDARLLAFEIEYRAKSRRFQP